MDEYIVKYLLKKNKGMSQSVAEKKAKKIWDDYCEHYKERDQKREIEHNRRFEEALKWESYNTLFEYMDEQNLDD